jgi:hypothetical protein
VDSEFTGTPDRVNDRVAFLLGIAEKLFDSKVLDKQKVFLNSHRIRICAEGYFLLNHAYKKWRMPKSHNTEMPKVAAMQSMTIVRIQPLIPFDTKNVASRYEAQCNEIFALAVADALLEIETQHNDDPKMKNFYLRLLDFIAESSTETIETFLVDKSLSNNKPLKDYKLEIHPKDQDRTNGLITIFELMAPSIQLT